MPITLLDIKKILKLLGRKGAHSGLINSDLSEKDLMQVALKAKLQLSENSSKEDLVNDIIASLLHKEILPTDELLKLSYDDLIKYFADVSPTSDQLLTIMNELNYKVSSEDKKNLRRFVARQISETALFSSVASRGVVEKDN